MKRSEGVVNLVRQWIDNGALAPGAKAPSVRQMSRIAGCSMSTVHQAYGLLENAGVFVALPRSGFYIDENARPRRQARLAARRARALRRRAGNFDQRIDVAPVRVVEQQRNPAIRRDLRQHRSCFRSRTINRHFRRVLRDCQGSKGADTASSTQGDPALRETVAQRYVEHGIALSANDIVLTAGGMHALNLCINILTKPGDIVLIESPTMFPVFTALEHRGLRAVEIPYSPSHGLDPDQFQYLIDRHDVRACVLMPAHHYPTGVSTPQDAVRKDRGDRTAQESADHRERRLHGSAIRQSLRADPQALRRVRAWCCRSAASPTRWRPATAWAGWCRAASANKIMQMKFAEQSARAAASSSAPSPTTCRAAISIGISAICAAKLLARMERGLGADRPTFPARLQGDEAIRRLHVLGRRAARIRFRCRLPRRAGARRRFAARSAVLGARGLPQLYRAELVVSLDARRRSAPQGDRRTCPRTLVGSGCDHAAAARPQSSAVASLAPSASASSFAHMIEGCTRR